MLRIRSFSHPSYIIIAVSLYRNTMKDRLKRNNSDIIFFAEWKEGYASWTNASVIFISKRYLLFFLLKVVNFCFWKISEGGILFKYFLERGKVYSRIKLNERENENYRNDREKIRKHFNVGKHLRFFALKYCG